MSTPEDVAAQPDWDAKARAIITACVGERAAIGHVAWRKAIADALREAEQRGTASQRATIERLERALAPFANMLRDDIVPTDSLQRKLQEWCKAARAALSASAKTAEDRA